MLVNDNFLTIFGDVAYCGNGSDADKMGTSEQVGGDVLYFP